MDVAAAADPTFRAADPTSTLSAPAVTTPPPSFPEADAAATPTAGAASGAPADATAPAPAQPAVATLPPTPPKKSGPIADDVIKLFNQQQQNVEVSYRIEKGLDEVVTVFTDKTTGKTIVQFPSETLIALAQLFDKIAGSVLDKKV